MQYSYSDSRLIIDLSKIRENFLFLSEKSNSATTSAVVKANAYGLGVDKVAPVLMDSGCRDFFVAMLDEAIELRGILGDDCNIYVFHGVKKVEVEAFVEFNIIPVINDFQQLELWQNHARAIVKKLPAIIHIDTGLNRLGINFEEIDLLAEKIESYKGAVEVRYLMSHLSCITQDGHPLNEQQLEKMNIIRIKFPNIPISFSNSRGVVISDDYHFDMVRPGSAIYGIGRGCGERVFSIKPVVTLKSKIIQIKQVQNDGFVGYGATKSVSKGTKLAVVPVGYADGYLRNLTNKSHGCFNGHKIPLVGIVSMDMIIFDISKVPENEINVGDEVELIGENVTIDCLAEQAETIGYEIFTRLGSRMKREYVG